MATMEQLKAALINADKAGDTAAAQALAMEIRRQQADADYWNSAQAEPETSAEGLIGAVTRGAGPIASGAALGAAVGAPFGGIGAGPGAAAGAGAVGLTTLIGDPAIEALNSMLGTNYTKPSEAWENLFTRLGVAEPKTAAERIVQTTAQAAAIGGATSGVGRTIAGMRNPAVAAAGEQLASKPVQQIIGAAGSGAGSQATAEAGGGPVAQLLGGIAGGLAAGGIGGVRGIETPDVAAKQAAIANAEKQGIPVTTSDIRPPSTFIGRSAQSFGERIPVVGTGGIRSGQQVDRVRAIRNVLDEFGANDAAGASDDVMKDLLKTRGDALSKYSAQKADVISKLSSRGTVPVTNATKAIDDQLALLNRNAGTPEIDTIIKDLQSFRQSIQGKDLDSIEQLRAILGERYAGADMATIRKAGEKYLSKIYGPLREDMGAFIKTNGDRRDFTKWAVANKQLSNMAGELQDSALKAMLRRGAATPELIVRSLFSKKPSEVRALAGQLSLQGKANARMAILAKAAEDSRVDMPDGSVSISPEKFTNSMRRMAPSVSAFFTGNDWKRVDALTRAIQLTRRAGESPVMTKTGQEAVMPITIAASLDVFQTSGAALGGGVALGTLFRAYESKPVRDMLIRLPSLKRGSAEEAELAKRIIATIGATANKKEQK